MKWVHSTVSEYYFLYKNKKKKKKERKQRRFTCLAPTKTHARSWQRCNDFVFSILSFHPFDEILLPTSCSCFDTHALRCATAIYCGLCNIFSPVSAMHRCSASEGLFVCGAQHPAIAHWFNIDASYLALSRLEHLSCFSFPLFWTQHSKTAETILKVDSAQFEVNLSGEIRCVAKAPHRLWYRRAGLAQKWRTLKHDSSSKVRHKLYD